MLPSTGTAPKVGLMPVTPQYAAGSRIEPPPSAPTDPAIMRVPTALAGPPLEPPPPRAPPPPWGVPRVPHGAICRRPPGRAPAFVVHVRDGGDARAGLTKTA